MNAISLASISFDGSVLVLYLDFIGSGIADDLVAFSPAVSFDVLGVLRFGEVEFDALQGFDHRFRCFLHGDVGDLRSERRVFALPNRIFLERLQRHFPVQDPGPDEPVEIFVRFVGDFFAPGQERQGNKNRENQRRKRTVPHTIEASSKEVPVNRRGDWIRFAKMRQWPNGKGYGIFYRMKSSQRLNLSSGSRRHFLKGLGASVCLPALEIFGKTSSPIRMAYVYTPNGIIMPKWTPKSVGKDWQLPQTLQSLGRVKNDIQVITGLAHDKADPNGDGGGDHARATATFLTGRQARKTAGSDIQLGISVDQHAVRAVKGMTKLDSLQLGCDPARRAGRCDSGYSCAYQFNFSWSSPTMPLAPEIDPRLVFERMFGRDFSAGDKESRAKRLSHRKSLLDYVKEDAKSLQKNLGVADARKIDEYLNGVREVEKKIENAEKFRQQMPNGKKPEGIPAAYRDHIRIMYDLMVMAFQSDTTRIATFLVAHDGSNRSFREIGVSDGHHQISHHRDDKAKIAKLEKIDKFYVDQFAYFMNRMKETKDHTGANLLDQSMIVYGGGISDGNKHDHDNLPVILAGGGGGSLRKGRHFRTRHTPMTNMYLSMLDRFGVKLDRLGDSTGRFDLI